VPIAASVKLSIAGSEGQRSIDSTVANISLTGIGLYADCLLGRGSAVSIEINFIGTDGLMKTDLIEGSILNANEIEDLCYLCVVFNEELTPQKQPSLYEHLQKILSQY
jgi:hypothetical protein